MLAFFAAHSKLIDQIGINALLALSLSISLRAGALALAQAAFMGIAAYVGAIGAVQAGWNLPESLLAGALAAGIIGALLALPIGRLRGVFLAIATIGFGEIARIVEINVPITGGAEGYSNIPSDASTWWIYGTLLAVAVALIVFSRSKAALAVAATREDEAAARGVGIDVTRVRFGTLVAGAVVAGLAGVLYAHANFFITPGDFGFGRMEQILVACVIGGVTSSIGAVLGALLLTLLPEAVRFLADYREVSSGAILLGIVLFAPDGIAGIWRRRA
ncbi:MAG: branched-chain amino acid ABC transporter permease [Candidatus Eremiobacteraeota bacterium]|nr:branched-chain amino acid ABC transporter permease [Candidatus Eremiobacteraeota bacterium]